MKIFLSWSGDTGKNLAVCLKKNIEAMLPSVNVFVSEYDIESGDKWIIKLQSELEESSYGIICITEESFDSQWLLFEAGALSKYSESRVCCLLSGKIDKYDIPLPLQQFQNKYLSKSEFKSLVLDINRQLGDLAVDESRLATSFSIFWPSIEREVESLREVDDKNKLELQSSIFRMMGVLKDLSKDEDCTNNTYLTKIVKDSIDEFCSYFSGMYGGDATFRQPYILYPQRLLSLLTTLSPTVKALAHIDNEEKFWRDRPGTEVWRNTNKNSSRVFIFRNKKQMIETMPTLLSHAARYNVYALSYDNLLLEHNDYNYDYSIIGDPSIRILARYCQPSISNTAKDVMFETDSEIISLHEDVINSIINNSIRIIEGVKEDELIEKVFTSLTGEKKNLAIYENKKIEMSAYISVIEYDQHEEQHAYYIELADMIVKKIQSHSMALGRRIRVLELGAGTGLFTKRLSTLDSVETVAVEIDWACYVQLRHNIQRLKRINKELKMTCHNEDSRIFDPEGNFDIIVSVFADHHIKPYDKPAYLENVKQNLNPDGMFIVGDEFIPEYSGVKERREALEKYHGHIIDIANSQNQAELAKLETAALKSGLDELGDFKLSNLKYETLLRKAGFSFEVHKVGPVDIDDIGGVFLYEMSKEKEK